MFGDRTTYFFVRHGQDRRREVDTMADHPLTELGRRQAAGARDYLRSAGLTHAYSSQILRARETAGIITEPLGLEIRIWDDLEEIRMPDAEDIPIKLLPFKFAFDLAKLAVDLDWESRIGANGESAGELWERTARVWEYLKDNHGADDRVLVVSHQIFLNALLSTILDIPLDKPALLFNLENCAVVRVIWAHRYPKPMIHFEGVYRPDFEVDGL
ncbi:MAG: histidine phosphatase family protein [bacterium]|nr:histidine phosphatase family protein [bacterium]